MHGISMDALNEHLGPPTEGHYPLLLIQNRWLHRPPLVSQSSLMEMSKRVKGSRAGNLNYFTLNM